MITLVHNNFMELQKRVTDSSDVGVKTMQIRVSAIVDGGVMFWIICRGYKAGMIHRHMYCHSVGRVHFEEDIKINMPHSGHCLQERVFLSSHQMAR